MKTGKIFYCVLSVILIIASLHHISLFSRCNQDNRDIQQSLNRNYLSNQKLLGEIHFLQRKTSTLHNVSEEKLAKTKNKRNGSNKLGESASKLIKSIQNKLFQHQQLNQEINDQYLKNKKDQKAKDDKVLKSLLPPLSEQPYLLIEPKQ